MNTQNTTNGSLPDREYLTVPEVSVYLSLSEKTIYAWCSKGRLPSVKLGGAVRIPKKDFLVWLEARKRKTA